MNDRTYSLDTVKRILVATGGSASSKDAITEALNLAVKFSAKLFVVSVAYSTIDLENTHIWQMEQAQAKLSRKLDPIRLRAAERGIDCEIITRRGDNPYEDILEEARRNQVDLIVVGTHCRTGLSRLIGGSVAGKVISDAPCSVLVVPPGMQSKHESILAVTDPSREGASSVLQAISISKRGGNPLSIAYVASSTEESRAAEEDVRKAVALAKKEGIKAEGIVLHGSPYDAVAKAAKTRDIDLVVMARGHKPRLKDSLFGSVTERILGHAHTAVLVPGGSNI